MQLKVVVGVCTFRRPKMLRVCLDSLAAQVAPPDIALSIVVVDNEPEPNNRGVVEGFAPACPFPVHYVHQPRRGIAAARNAVLDKATELGADWIAMMDDDETADPNWIADLMAPEYRHVPVLMGKHSYVYPDPPPFWVVRRPRRGDKPISSEVLQVASTSNVRFSTDLLRAGLRFDESLGFLPTEDWRFFKQGYRLGFHIERHPRAITNEPLHPERLTYRAIMGRVYGHYAALTRNAIYDEGRAAAYREVPSAMRDVMIGAVEVLLSPLAAPFSMYRFKRLALTGGRTFARGWGRMSAVVGVLPQPYRTTAGS
jgi:succinoglycan biosynthesis protein ExoM